MPTRETAIGYFAEPNKGSLPGVVMIPDVFGLSDHYRDLANRLAGEGFVVLAIDPYLKTGYPEINSSQEALAWIDDLDDLLILKTIHEAMEFVSSSVTCSGSLGVTGFCMGGQYALLSACQLSGLSACAAFYGMVRYEDGLDPNRKPRSPLESIPNISCPVLGLYGEEDAIVPIEDVYALEKALGVVEVQSQVNIYSGAGHAFMNNGRPDAFRPEAAKDAWTKLVSFFHTHLEV